MKQLLGCLALSDAPPLRLPHVDRETAQNGRVALAAPLLRTIGAFTIAAEGEPRLVGAPDESGYDALVSILSAYRKEGTAALQRVRGPFALAIVDGTTGDAVLALDRMGIHSLCWAVDGSQLLFGSSAAAVARLQTKGATLNRQALFDFMLMHAVPAPDSVFVGVNKLLPASCLRRHDGRIETARYWTPEFRHVTLREADGLQQRVLPTIERAIARCRPDERTGTFLSGGLDSSTVTGVLTKTRTTPTHAFSVGFGVAEFNELAYARLAAEKFGCVHHIYEVVPEDIVELVPRIAAAYDEPFGNSSAVPTLCCARLAKSHGMDHLLAGDGGDEIFGGNERYVRQKPFELYARLPHWLRSAVIEPFAARLNPDAGFTPLRKLASYVRQARVPLPERFEAWNLIYREGAATVFDGDFLESVDTGHALRRMRETWEACPSTDPLDRMLWYDWKLTLSDNDLRKVSQMCELAGVRVSYPMIDEDLLDLSIAVPSAAKISGTELRTFFKRAAAELLPPEIINKQKHGFGLPFGAWLKTHVPLQKLVYGALESLRGRGIFRGEFVDRVVAEHRSGHAGYYGYAIWDMLMLEQWLQLQPKTNNEVIRAAGR